MKTFSVLRFAAFLLLCVLFINHADAREVYVHEYNTKKPGLATMVFLVTEDSSVIERMHYSVSYNATTGIIHTIQRTVDKENWIYRKNENGSLYNPLTPWQPIEGHTAEWLKTHYFHPALHPLLHPDYLSLNNEEKLTVMEVLARKYTAAKHKKKSS